MTGQPPCHSSNIKAAKQHHQRPRPQQLSKIKTQVSRLRLWYFFDVPLLIFGLQVAQTLQDNRTSTAAAMAATCNSTAAAAAATFVSSSSSSSTCAASVPRQNVNRCNQALSDSAEAQRGLNFAKYTDKNMYTPPRYKINILE